MLHTALQSTQPHYDTPSNRPAHSSIYSDPVTRDCPKLASNDYEAIPDAKNYYSMVKDDDPIQNSNDATLSTSSRHHGTTGSVSTDGSDEEAIYLDPGHSEKAIYAYFESKKFRIISDSTVK